MIRILTFTQEKSKKQEELIDKIEEEIKNKIIDYDNKILGMENFYIKKQNIEYFKKYKVKNIPSIVIEITKEKYIKIEGFDISTLTENINKAQAFKEV
jgi:hypothetical protein